MKTKETKYKDDKANYSFFFEKSKDGKWEFVKDNFRYTNLDELDFAFSCLKKANKKHAAWLDTIDWISYDDVDSRFHFSDGWPSHADAFMNTSNRILKTLSSVCMGLILEMKNNKVIQ